MSSSSLAPIVAHLVQKNSVGTEDVMAMRLAVFDDAGLSPEDAAALMALDERIATAGPEWRIFFVEALTDFVVHQEAPHGTVDPAKARWLMGRVGRDATVKPNELELLVAVLEAAASAPSELTRFTLKQIKHSVLWGEKRNTVTASQVELTRRVLLAGCGGPVLSREDAEVLFEIADATWDADNAPSWTDLFVKTVVNLLMASSGYVAPSRKIALRRGRWLDSTNAVSGSLADKVKATIGHGILDIYSLSNGAAVVSEAAWLRERISGDARLGEIEQALLERVRAEASSLHPTLQPLFEWAA